MAVTVIIESSRLCHWLFASVAHYLLKNDFAFILKVSFGLFILLSRRNRHNLWKDHRISLRVSLGVALLKMLAFVGRREGVLVQHLTLLLIFAVLPGGKRMALGVFEVFHLLHLNADFLERLDLLLNLLDIFVRVVVHLDLLLSQFVIIYDI